MSPFNAASAHHRPIGDGAEYAPADHLATRDWLKATTLGFNVGATWGVSVADTDEADPYRTIKASATCDAVSGLPVTIRLPQKGFVTRVAVNADGCPDGVVVVYDRATGRPHQLRQYNWKGGNPTAGQYRTWDIKGLGHGTEPGERIGTSASGVAALFGILRGQEINTPGHKVGHALQAVLPGVKGCKIMLSRDIVLPAVSRDRGATDAGNNTGHIPYGGLLALPRWVDVDSLGLSEPGRRLAEAIQAYGIYAVDNGGCANGAIRTDQHVSSTVLAQLKADMPTIYRQVRLVLNNDVLGNAVAGGGTPRAPNCAFDAP